MRRAESSSIRRRRYFLSEQARTVSWVESVGGAGALWSDLQQAFGPFVSTTTLWRLVDERIDIERLPGIWAARAHSCERGRS
jgi:hypothetical protein